MDVMNLLKKLNVSEEEQKYYKVTFCYPVIELEHEKCDDHNHYVSSNYTNVIEVKSIITKIIKCKHIDNFDRQKWCHNCSHHSESNTCNRITPLTSF